MSQLEPTCHLAQDLMVAYAAGEVSEVTRHWMDDHLAECPSCAVLWLDFEIVGRPVPAVPSAEPGRKLIRRIRRDVGTLLLLTAVSLVALVLVISWPGGGGRTVTHEETAPVNIEGGGDAR